MYLSGQVTIFDSFENSNYPFRVIKETIVRPLWEPKKIASRNSLIFMREAHAKYLWRIFTGSILRGAVDGRSVRHRRFNGSYVSYLWAFGYLSNSKINANKRAKKYLEKRGYDTTKGFSI